MAFKERFKQLREARGMTQSEVAKLLDPPYTAQAVHKWEVNGNTPKMAVLRQIADIFGVSVSDLLDESDRLMPVPSTATLPLLNLGTVHAGEPKEAIEDDLVIQAPADVVNRHPNGFFLQVEGTCMDRAYPEGCHILVDPDMQPHNGSAVVAEFMGDTVLRRFHDLRHTYATMAIAGGADIRSVASILGHSSVAMTLDVYAAPDEDAKRRAADLIGAELEKGGTPKDAPRSSAGGKE